MAPTGTQDYQHTNDSKPVSVQPIYSMIVCSPISNETRGKLSTVFGLIDSTSNPQGTNFDSALVDCRSAAITIPENLHYTLAKVRFALVDEKSWIAEKHSSQSIRLELITEADLDNGTLPLKFQLAMLQHNNIETEHELPTPSKYRTANQSQNLHESGIQLLDHFLDHTSDWVVIKDLQHRFIAVSELFMRSQKLPINKILGKNDLEIGTDEELVLGNPEKNWKGYWHYDDELVASGKPSTFSHIVLRENCIDRIRENVAKIPLKNSQGEVYALMVFVTQTRISKLNGIEFSETTSRRKSTQSLHLNTRIAEQLNNSITFLAQSETALTDKSNFISIASHDLRQPLHAIGLFVDSLQNETANKEHLETLGKIKSSSEILTGLLNSILDLSKLDANAVGVAKTNFSIGKLLSSTKDEFQTDAEKKLLTLNVSDSNNIIYTDRLLLARVIRNLVSNAVKHTQHGSVDITTHIDNRTLLLKIKDTGPGIPRHQYQTIFLEYHQINDNYEVPNFGTGLGLSIVRRLLDLLNLQIDLETAPDQGTCFSISIPLSDDKNHVCEFVEEGIPTQPFAGAHKILVLDDNPIVLEAACKMLNSIDCDAYPASNIEEALEIIEELDELPDLLLVDYQLGDGVTGDMAIKQICDAAQQTLPAIIVTGNTNDSLFHRVSSADFRVLIKPVGADVLRNNITSVIQERKSLENAKPSKPSKPNNILK